MRYELIIYWSKTDECFIAEVPELPGCLADGGSYEEAVANAQLVIQEWVETARSLGPCHSRAPRQTGLRLTGRRAPENDLVWDSSREDVETPVKPQKACGRTRAKNAQ